MSAAEEIRKLDELRRAGIISDVDFEAGKLAALGISGRAAQSEKNERQEAGPTISKGLPKWSVEKLVYVTIAGLLAAFFLVGGLWNRPVDLEAKERAKAQAEQRERLQGGIELCWKDWERRSLTDSKKRFIAGVCEKMEEDYRKQYHSAP